MYVLCYFGLYLFKSEVVKISKAYFNFLIDFMFQNSGLYKFPFLLFSVAEYSGKIIHMEWSSLKYNHILIAVIYFCVLAAS